MKKKTLPEIILLLILTSTTWFAVFNPVTGGASSAGGSPTYGESDRWWWMFHHDSTHTGYSNSTMPNQLCQFWNTSGMIKGSVKSSPAVVGNKVFVGSSDKKVYALNAINGTHVWNYTTGGAVLSSPAVTSDRVFVGSDDGCLYALNATAKPLNPSQRLKWSFPTDGKIVSSPAVAYGMVFFGSYDGYVYALNATSETATEIWKFRTAYPVCSSPAISGNRVFVGTSDGRVYALNVTGRYEWHFSAGSNCSSSPTVAGGMVFVGSDNRNVYALNETTGNEIWSYQTGGAVKSSPAVADGIVFVGSDDGYLYALNATTKSPSGDLKWRRPTGDKIASSPAIADNKVFVGSSDNRTYAFNTTDGSPIWNVTLAGSICSSPAITKIDKYDILFIGCDDMKVYAFGPKNEAPRPIISPPQQPFILQNVTFDASASYDPDSDILNCTWNFGDGPPSKYPSWQNGKKIYHKYGTARIYNVTLSLTDYHPIPRLRKTNMTYCLVMVNDAWPTYRHDISHTGCSTSFGPVTNQTLWNLTINSSPSSDGLMCSSPAVIYGVAYVGSTNGTVFAVNVTDGSIIWRRKLGGALHSSPAVADGLVFIGSDDMKVYALNASSGVIKWSCATVGWVYSSPTVWDGLVYVASQEGKIYALKEFAEPGNYTYNDSRIRKWEFPALYSYVHSSPAVADGLVFTGHDDKRVSALNALTGGFNWSYQTGGAVKSSPAVADGIVFVGSDDGYLYALNATTKSSSQRLIWRFLTGGKIASSPTVADGMVFVGSDDGYLYALNATAKPLSDLQRRIWREKIGSVDSVGYSSPVVADCKVFVGSKDGKIYAFHKENGEPVWTYRTGGSIYSSPAISNDALYITSGGSLYAFSRQVHDVAIKGVTATPSRVPQGGTVTISLVAENEGSFNETGINVTIYYSNATYMEVANRTVISDLYRHDKTTVALPWNTGNVAVGTYKINATITPATDDDPADNNREGGNVTVGGWYDMSIQDAWVGYNVTNTACRLKKVVCQGYNATIYVTVKNGGGMEGADINVIAYWSNSSHFNQTIGSCVIPYLLINESRTVAIIWNTNAIGVLLSKGNYTIRAYALPVPGENDTANNNFPDGWIIVSMVGDITGPDGVPDGKVDLRDVFAVGRAYGSVPCEPDWNPNCDINNDEKVDLKDYMIVTRNYGK